MSLPLVSIHPREDMRTKTPAVAALILTSRVALVNISSCELNCESDVIVPIIIFANGIAMFDGMPVIPSSGSDTKSTNAPASRAAPTFNDALTFIPDGTEITWSEAVVP